MELTSDNREKLIFSRNIEDGTFEIGDTLRDKGLIEKLKMYASCQVIPTINLLTTYETAYHPLDCEQVENIIKETFL